MIVLYKMLLAHFIGDFLLQPAGWVRAKEQKKLGAYQLYIHVLVHVLLVMVLVWQKGFFLVGIFVGAATPNNRQYKAVVPTGKDKTDILFC